MSNNGFPTPKSNITTYANLDKNLILSPADFGKVICITGITSFGVMLPDCRQAPNTTNTVSISNKMSTSVVVYDNNGNVITEIAALKTESFANNTLLSSGGRWVTASSKMGVTAPLSFSSGTPLVLFASGQGATYSPSTIVVQKISNSKAIAAYRGTNGYIYLNILSISGSTITAGTGVQVTAFASMPQSICAISDTTAIVAFALGSPNYYAAACVITISGTSASVGTITTVNSLTTINSDFRLCKISNAKVAIYYRDGSNNQYANVLTISGTSISVGTVSASGGSGFPKNITRLTDTLLIGFYNTGVRLIRISGTSITFDTAFSVAGLGGSGSILDGAMLSDTLGVFSTSSGLYWIEVKNNTVSGYATNSCGNVQAIASMSTTQVIASGASGNVPSATIINSGLKPSVGTDTTIYNEAGYSNAVSNICSLSLKQAVAIWAGYSTFTTVAVLTES